MSIRYFLGAISPGGFTSLYPELMDRAKRVYIIKSGPGSGKSSFMRRVAQRIEQNRPDTVPEFIHCSSDPESLDAVVFPSLGAAIVDGTPPHALEPRYPGIVERYLPLCQFTDYTGLETHESRLRALIDQNAACYRRAYLILDGLRAVRYDMLGLMLDDSALQKIRRRTAGIIAKTFSGKSHTLRNASAEPHEKKCFLNAFTPAGSICHYETAQTLCENIYELEDRFGLAPLMLTPILHAAREAGHDAMACYHPLSPNEPAHILFPSLSMGFVISDAEHTFPGDAYRRVRLDACLSGDLYRQHRLRLRFLRKTERALRDEALDILRQAGGLHDEMEALYNPHTNFDAVYEKAEQIAAEILAL